MREKKERPSHISELLARTSKRRSIGDILGPYLLASRWEEIVGEVIAAHSCPVKLRHKVLTVKTSHPAWVQELNFLKPKIIERLAKAQPKTKINDVRFELGDVPPRLGKFASPDLGVRHKKLGRDEIEFIDQAAKEIPDPALRDTARRAMEMCFKAKSRATESG